MFDINDIIDQVRYVGITGIKMRTGYVGRSELRPILGDENISQFMKSADENGDDELSAKEWQAHLDRRKTELDPTFELHFQNSEVEDALQSRARQKGGNKNRSTSCSKR